MNTPKDELIDGIVLPLQRSAGGCLYLIYLLEKVRKVVMEKGELTEANVNSFKISLKRQPEFLVEKLEEFYNWLVTNPEKLEPEALRSRHRAEVLEFLNEEISTVKVRWGLRQEREDDEERAKEAAAVLPPPEVLDKILRYETALEHQVYRAMNHLERLQRRRLGEIIPAPLNVEVSAKA